MEVDVYTPSQKADYRLLNIDSCIMFGQKRLCRFPDVTIEFYTSVNREMIYEFCSFVVKDLGLNGLKCRSD